MWELFDGNEMERNQDVLGRSLQKLHGLECIEQHSGERIPFSLKEQVMIGGLYSNHSSVRR